MANKYCDHGAYGSGTGVASTSGSSTTLTIASTSAGVFGVGSELSGTGITAGTHITALGTYNGISGTVTMSAARTVPASTAITGIYGQPLNVPSAWGVPQEGDGTAATAATASAIATIDMSGATAAATNTFSVMGAALTCVASGATTNQFNAGSGTTLIDNLVIAINRTTNTVIVAAQATGWATYKLQDVVYARRTGNNLEIMTRAGSATYNGLTAAAWVGVTGLTGPYTWSGGSGGCWGYLQNHSYAMWPSAVATRVYGFWTTTTQIAGCFLASDTCTVRSGKNITSVPAIAMYPGATLTGTKASSTIVVIDNGTVWTADAPNPVLTVQSSAYFGQHIVTFDGFCSVKASKYSSGQRNLVFSVGGEASYANVAIGKGGCSAYNVDFLTTLSVTASVWGVSFPGTTSTAEDKPGKLIGCRIKWNGADLPIFSITQYYTQYVYVIDSEFDCTGSVTANSGVIAAYPGAVNYLQTIQLIGCKFTGFQSGSRLARVTTTCPRPGLIALQDCDMGNVSVQGPNLLQINLFDPVHARAGLYVTTTRGMHEFSMDNPGVLYCEWNQARGYPTCNARLLDGSTPWSIYAVPSNNAAIGTKTPVSVYSIAKLVPSNTDLPQASRSFVFNFLAESTLTVNVDTIGLWVTYTNSSSQVQFLDTGEVGTLSASTETWSATSWRGQTWTRYKVTFATPDAVLAESEVQMQINLYQRSAADTLAYIIDPEVLMT